MAFKKYPSIENTYREKEINWWLSRFPELENTQYIIQEKLHGANFSLEFSPEGKWFAAKRSGRIKVGENFYNYDPILERNEYKIFIEKWSEKAKQDQVTYHLHGELFGGGVQKGVDYGPVKRILFFDFSKDQIMQPPQAFIDIMILLGLESFVVPFIALVSDIQKALDYPIHMNTKEGPPIIGDNIIEGVVIKPFTKVFCSPQGSVFMLKKKNQAFKEKQKVKRNKKEENVPPHVQLLKEEFDSYMTEKRLQGIFSKEGEIEKPSQLGDYIRFFIADAREDFLKDKREEIETLGKKEKNYVFNVSKIAVEMLKKYL